ncbi:MAG TPA: hypothetical protein VEV61_08440 [Streptosporangiaceae bacterium]|nr:hypothetical protein [Streptosporangiaceae bacterium]
MTQVQPRQPMPFLAQPWQGGITGWIVVFGAIIVELVGGIVVNSMSMAVAAPVLIAPAVIVLAFSVAQWVQMRSFRSERPSWWHMGAIAMALFTWAVWPVSPSALQSNAHDTCSVIYTATPDCIARVTSATTSSNITWWVTAGLIVALVPLARRSRIAAWATIPVAFAGCQLASHFYQLLLLHYHFVGA